MQSPKHDLDRWYMAVPALSGLSDPLNSTQGWERLPFDFPGLRSFRLPCRSAWGRPVAKAIPAIPLGFKSPCLTGPLHFIEQEVQVFSLGRLHELAPPKLVS